MNLFKANSQIQSSPRRRSSRVRKPIISQVESNSDEDEESLPSSDHHPQPHRKKSKTLVGTKKPIRTRKPRIQKPKTKLNINLNSKRIEDQENDRDEGLRSDRETGNHLKSDYVISQDNDLFNSIQKGSSAIEPTLEDWIEMYKGKDQNQTDSNEDARAEGIAVLINCILRCCGCNNSIDKDEALDLDAVPERLDDIQEEFKKCAFFITIKLLHDFTIILVSMTTSSLRSIRHTSTFICLFGLMSSFIEILIQVSDELNQLKKKVSDLKNKNHNNRSGTDERLIEWEKRKSLVSDQKESLENHLNDFFDGVFVHRYRDSDPKIRVECIQALGQWMNQLPDHFLGGHYLRYLGWVLTDTVRVHYSAFLSSYFLWV
ncbi:hypothetical protein DFH28DRAFT_895666 [Melampsora americana]|nr:hypothetical protein DFH28DRAFT_895666 [Melampsora americana]